MTRQLVTIITSKDNIHITTSEITDTYKDYINLSHNIFKEYLEQNHMTMSKIQDTNQDYIKSSQNIFKDYFENNNDILTIDSKNNYNKLFSKLLTSRPIEECNGRSTGGMRGVCGENNSLVLTSRCTCDKYQCHSYLVSEVKILQSTLSD